MIGSLSRREKIRLGAILAIILGLAVLVVWLNTFIRKAGFDLFGERTAPDIYVENFREVKVRPIGGPKPPGPMYETTGKMMTHYPATDSYMIDEPVIYSLSKGGQLQTISSLQAYVEDFNSRIHLMENVLMTREPLGHKRPLKLTTDYLLLFPDEQRAETDRFVTIEDDRTVMTGIGLDANHATGQATVKSRVRVSISPGGMKPPIDFPEFALSNPASPANAAKEENQENPDEAPDAIPAQQSAEKP